MQLIEIKIIGIALAISGIIAAMNSNYEAAAFLFLLTFVYGVVSCAE
jgi:hypothetical protein